MKLKTPALMAALVLIGVGGFMAGRVSSPEASPESAERPAETRASRASSSMAAGDSAASRSSRGSRPERVRTAMTGERTVRLEAIVRSENPLDRNRALLAFLDQLAPGDFEEAVGHFRSLGMTENRMGEYSLLLTAWAQADPLTALAYAEKNTRGGFAQDTILTSWAATDPEAAIRWAQSQYEGDGANPFMPGIIRGMVETNPVRATELLTRMPRSSERGKGLDYMLPHLLQRGVDATRDWIATLTDESLKNGAMLRAAGQMAVTDPAGTAAWLRANPSEATQRRMDDVYSAWAKSDKQAALNSFSALPAGEIRSNALRGVVSSMAAENPKAAVSMMDQYPNDVNDRVVQNFIWQSFGSDPSTAAGQIARIADVGQRDRMYQRTLAAWIDRDPATAQAWIQSNALPEAVRADLLRRQGTNN
ncbi:MAG: hypothetical protein WED15_09885 [Akkermansiaceae bacterium]